MGGGLGMNVAVVSSGHIPSQWAHSINTVKTANAFSKIGHNVEILTVERFLEKREKQKINNVHRFYGIGDAIKIAYFKDNPLFYFEEINSPIHYFSEGIKRTTNGRIRYVSDPEKRISEYCRKNSMDLSYCRAYRTAYYNVKNGIPTILESHTPNTKHPELRRVIKLSHSEYFEGLVTISDILKQNFIAAGVPEDKVLVLDDGVDIASFRNLPSKEEIRGMFALPRDRKMVVYSGSLFPDKGIEHILLVARNLPDVLFLLVGGREQQIKMWEKYVDSCKIENVQFTGFVGTSKVPLYLKAADVLIMPYKTDQEIKIMDINTTSPLKLFEYMAAKKPIVSSAIPAISRTIVHEVDGLLAKPNDIQELTHFVELVLEDEQLAEKIAENAYTKVQDYDWKNRCEKILRQLTLMGGVR